MRLSDFSYDLPEDRIAQYPLPQRDTSRMMVVNRGNQDIEDKTFFSLPDYLRTGDLLVLNDTQVIPCRLFGQKQTGGKIEVFFLSPLQENVWEVLIRGQMSLGESFLIAQGSVVGEIIEKKNQGRSIAAFSGPKSIEQIMEEYGQVPLPPYIKHFKTPNQEDPLRYQTVFAKNKGAVAAPTAGLHFTKPLLSQLQAKGINITFITLHVGLGTFQPVKSEIITNHTMEPEFYRVTSETLQRIRETKNRGDRVIACGTTSSRVLESFGQNPSLPMEGSTDLFIYPGFSFKVVDALITNFHLPKSTLLMLVSAFAGRDFIFKAYQQAITWNYRFYSYGDAMLIL